MVVANVGLRVDKPRPAWRYITLIANNNTDLFEKLNALYEQEEVAKITVEKGDLNNGKE